MSYIGNTPTTQAFAPAVDYFSGNGSTTAFTLSRPIASVAQVEAYVNNVAQNPSTGYTVSGSTITFTGAPSAGTNNIYVRYTSPITQVQGLTQSPSVLGPMSVSINGAVGIGGATNPIVNMSGASNNYVQAYVNNTTNGVNSSADLVAYPSNGTEVSGWVDMGITSPSYSQAAFSVTGPNEAYLFGSAPSGSGTTGNLVLATDSTGSANSIQFYTNGFTKSKSAYAMQIDKNGVITRPFMPMLSCLSASTNGTALAGFYALGQSSPDLNVGSYFNTTTRLFTCPVAGNYRVSVSASNGDGQFHYINAVKNGTAVGAAASLFYTTYTSAAQSVIIPCAAGDTLGATNRFNSGLYGAQLSIELIG